MLPANSQPMPVAMEREIGKYLEHAPNFGGAPDSENSNFYTRMGI